MCFIQTLPLPQLRREDGHLLVTAATGGFTLRRARAELAVRRAVEVRAARQAGRTGSINEYNFLAALLPQETRVCYVRL